MKGDENLKKIAKWIVEDWGKINGFNFEKDNRIDVIKNINNDINLSFESISSMSKIASFYAPDKCAIYDSRVAYSLNWIIYDKRDELDKDNLKFYPQPSGLNSKLQRYNLNTIFYLTSDMDEPIYHDKKDAYKLYCELLANTCNLLKEKYPEIKIYDLEMWLFVEALDFANNEIPDAIEIRKKH